MKVKPIVLMIPKGGLSGRAISLAAFRLWQRLEDEEADAKFIGPDMFPTKEIKCQTH